MIPRADFFRDFLRVENNGFSPAFPLNYNVWLFNVGLWLWQHSDNELNNTLTLFIITRGLTSPFVTYESNQSYRDSILMNSLVWVINEFCRGIIDGENTNILQIIQVCNCEGDCCPPLPAECPPNWPQNNFQKKCNFCKIEKQIRS